jgi:hypothetical protein
MKSLSNYIEVAVPALFLNDRLGKIARVIDVDAVVDRHEVGEHLQRNHFGESRWVRRQSIWWWVTSMATASGIYDHGGLWGRHELQRRHVRRLDQVMNKTTLQVSANDAQRVFGQPNPGAK